MDIVPKAIVYARSIYFTRLPRLMIYDSILSSSSFELIAVACRTLVRSKGEKQLSNRGYVPPTSLLRSCPMASRVSSQAANRTESSYLHASWNV